MKVESAIYHAVHDYKPGTDALARQMGMARSSLLNMANPNDDGHEVTVKRLRQVVHLTGDLRPVHALCAELGGVFVPTERFAGIADDALLDLVMRLGKEYGDVCAAVSAAIADGRVSPREMQAFREQKYQFDQAGAALEARLAMMAAPEPSAQLKVAK